MIEIHDTFQMILINVLLCFVWHMIILFLCKKINNRHFNYKLSLYKIRKFEKDGKVYTKYFKIKKWKDHIPQYVGKNGFSKKNLDLKNMNEEYLNVFLLETCRGEWNHLMNCLYLIIAFIFSPIIYAVIFSMLNIIANIPCIIIQRYNRIRLLKFKKRLSRKNITAGTIKSCH